MYNDCVKIFLELTTQMQYIAILKIQTLNLHKLNYSLTEIQHKHSVFSNICH